MSALPEDPHLSYACTPQNKPERTPPPMNRPPHEGTAPVDTLLARAGDLFMSAPNQALALADEALALLPTPADGSTSTPHALVRRVRGIALHYAGRHADGYAELNRALAAAPETDLGLRSRVLRALSMGCELHGAVDAALAWAKEALDAARRQDDQRLMRDALLSVGVAHSRTGDVEAGLTHFHQVLAMFEASGEDAGCMSVLNNMGINCKNLGRHADAIAHLERGLAFAGKVDDAAASAVLRSNLGEPLLALGRLDEARRELTAAIAALARCGYREAEINARV
ncbi:MAG TPA: tetratricopeptide repeat protein, partial [Burkholderiaceae bacterium]|nr:tetratricopeptide repeat protein [Burkholderiaceae bacterium]